MLIQLSNEAEISLIEGARDVSPVKGLTHGFYKYPARFSPVFARSAIEAFTYPGELVLDNHVGGGTTLVEALASGRDAIGVDISSLAQFVATAKTTIYSEPQLDALSAWAKAVPGAIHARKPSIRLDTYARGGYYKHLEDRPRWRLRKAIEQALAAATNLAAANLELFARCVVLRTAQWALDGRAQLPCLDEFRSTLETMGQSMVQGARELRAATPSPRPLIEIINRSAAGLEHDDRLRPWRAPSLVLTSPPYPGVHVLYHRWQVDGRKEAPLPFLIADKLDGAGGSYYTMGDRKSFGLATYFANIRATMASVAALADEETVVVQMVAFSDASWQLSRYLQAMEEAGLHEVFLKTLQGRRDGRLWRSVPNRRWYSDQRGATPGSQEVVLFHQKAKVSPSQLRDRLPARHSTDLLGRAMSGKA